MTTTVVLPSGHTLAIGGAQDDAKGRTLLLLLTASLVNDAGKTTLPAKPGAAQKAAKIVVPSMEFREASLADVVNFLTFKSRELDPEKKGINILVHAPKEAQAAKITLNLRNVPLLDAVRYVANIAGLKMTAAENALVLSPANAPAAKPPQPIALAGAAAEKARRIVVPSMQFMEAPMPSVAEFLTARSRQLDPEKIGVNIIFQTPPGQKPPTITLNLLNVPLLEALGYIAQIGGLELVAYPYALRLEPKRVK